MEGADLCAGEPGQQQVSCEGQARMHALLHSGLRSLRKITDLYD